MAFLLVVYVKVNTQRTLINYFPLLSWTDWSDGRGSAAAWSLEMGSGSFQVFWVCFGFLF